MGKRIVVPGELVTDKKKNIGQHVFVREGKIYSDCLGLVNDEANYASVVPLQGKYMPEMDDLVVGIVVSEGFSGYTVDINSFYPSFLNKKELREQLKPGSIISAKISSKNELNEVNLSNVRVFYGGETISVSSVKVPRIIGREGSMLNVLKQGTGSSLLVGRNGRIWIKGGNTELLVEAIKKIEREAHLDNLTDRITKFLEEATKEKKRG